MHSRRRSVVRRVARRGGECVQPRRGPTAVERADGCGRGPVARWSRRIACAPRRRACVRDQSYDDGARPWSSAHSRIASRTRSRPTRPQGDPSRPWVGGRADPDPHGDGAATLATQNAPQFLSKSRVRRNRPRTPAEEPSPRSRRYRRRARRTLIHAPGGSGRRVPHPARQRHDGLHGLYGDGDAAGGHSRLLAGPRERRARHRTEVGRRFRHSGHAARPPACRQDPRRGQADSAVAVGSGPGRGGVRHPCRTARRHDEGLHQEVDGVTPTQHYGTGIWTWMVRARFPTTGTQTVSGGYPHRAASCTPQRSHGCPSAEDRQPLADLLECRFRGEGSTGSDLGDGRRRADHRLGRHTTRSGLRT